ncbi:MAG TPA: FixH family protein [Devosia sp.]|nr:FixH family protein [Devosia sp.]
MPKMLSRRHLFWIVPLAVIAVSGVGMAARMLAPPPADLDLSLSKATERGLYVATLAADQSPIPVGTLHTWTVKVTTADGVPVETRSIAIDGGMPQHGHGLPTQPEVTTDLGGGSHLIEGMKFNMPGWWTLTVSIDGAQGADQATFNIVL